MSNQYPVYIQFCIKLGKTTDMWGTNELFIYVQCIHKGKLLNKDNYDGSKILIWLMTILQYVWEEAWWDKQGWSTYYGWLRGHSATCLKENRLELCHTFRYSKRLVDGQKRLKVLKQGVNIVSTVKP